MGFKSIGDFDSLAAAQDWFEKQLTGLAQQRVDEGQGEQQLGKKDKEYEEKLRQAFKDEDVDGRSPLGQRFAREHKDGEGRLRFQAQKSFSQKRAFRLEWAREQYSALQEKTQYSKSYERVDRSKGKYLPFRRIVAEEGGDQEAVGAALRYCQKAARMGGRWVSMNVMTSRMKFLYVARE